VLFRALLQLTPLQFYYNLQTASQRAATAAAAAAAVVKETAEERSSHCSTLSSCRRADVHASRARLASQSRWKRRQSLPGVDFKAAETDSGGGTAASGKIEKRKQALSKAGRRGHAKPRLRDTGEPATTRDTKDKSPAQGHDDEKKCDSGSVSGPGETERTGAVTSEKDCCGDGEKTGCSDQPAEMTLQPEQDAGKTTTIPECRLDDDNRKCEESSTSKSNSSASSTTTPAALSKLKIFKCSESKKLCVRSADVPEPSAEQSVTPTAAVPKLCVPKNLVARRSGLPVDVRVRKKDDDKRERRRHHRRRRRDLAKNVGDTKTIVDRTPTITDLDSALSPVPSVPDPAEDPAADRPTDALASSPLSSSDNVVSSSTSSRLLPDDEDDDDADAAHRAPPKSRPPRRTADDNDDGGGDEGKSGDQADATGDSATTLRVPIRLGGQSGQTGELLLRLPQNVSVQCSFRADQILIASSPATTSTEQSALSTGAGVARTDSSDVQLIASELHVSNTLLAILPLLLLYFCLISRF